MAQCAPAGSRARGTSMGGLYVTATLLALLASGAVCCFAFVDHHFVSFRFPNGYFLFPPCVLAVSFWFPHGLRFPIGFHMASLLISPGFHMVSLLFLHGFHLVPIWFPLGFLLVSTWFPFWLPHGFLAVSIWFPPGSLVVSIWFPCGGHMVSLWLLCGLHSAWKPHGILVASMWFPPSVFHVASKLRPLAFLWLPARGLPCGFRCHARGTAIHPGRIELPTFSELG